MNTKIILLLVIAIAFTIMVGCTSTTDPLIGSWQKETDKNFVYLQFNPDYTFKQWSSDSPSILTGSWKNEGSDWYSVATYSGTGQDKTYLMTNDWIYDKTKDGIYVKGYPEGRFDRAIQPLPSPPTPTLRPAPIFVPGDIIDQNNPTTDARWLVVSYDPTTDKYVRNIILRKDDGQWGCVMGGVDYTYLPMERDFVEQQYPRKFGHVSLDMVQDCYPVTTVTIKTIALPKFTSGDIIDEAHPIGDTRWLVVSYDSTSDQYEMKVIFRKDSGVWGCVVNGLHSGEVWHDRDFIEKYYPVKYAHTSLMGVDVC